VRKEITMRIANTCVALLALLLAGGCRVEERMVWSPDGSRAAVLLPQGLCLMDPNGTLSSPVANNVTAAAWLPNGQGLVLRREISVTNWTDAVRLLPPAEIATVESLARGMIDVMKGALAAAGGDASAVDEKFFKPLHIEMSEYLSAILLCLRDTRPAELRQAVQGVRDWEKMLSEPVEVKANELSILQLAGNSTRVLERTIQELGEAHPSPDGRAVAFLRRSTLSVAPLDGGTNRVCVAENVVGDFDWTPDGKALVYAVRLHEKWEANAVNLVRIERRAVEGEALPLASASVAFLPRVRCLTDGRVLFASLALQLPAPANAAQEARFYLVDPAQRIETVPSPAGALPAELGSFALSPDGRQVAVVESGSDVVAVLDLASGALEVVSPKRNGKCRTLPSWRNANELYFAALPQARPEWLRWTKGNAPHVISRQWTDESVKNLIEQGK